MATETIAQRPLLTNEENVDLYTTDDDEDELFSRSKSTSKKPVKITRTVKFITVFSALGQFLFGYDTGVISGSMLFLRKQFSLNDVWQEAIVSATIVAAAVFAMLGGPISDHIGRRLTALSSGILFACGSILLCFASSPMTLLLGRVVIGCGLGLTSMCLPMYLSECCPAAVRGRLLLLTCTVGCSGMLSANIVDGLFSYNEVNGWRYMLGLPAIPSLLLATGMFLLPESPRWLVKTGKVDAARRVLNKLRPASEVEAELNSIRKIVDEDNVKKIEAGRWVLVRMLLHGPTRRALMVGCGLQMFQQLAAINTVMYYTATIMKMAGIYNNHMAIWLSAVVAGVNVLFTVVGMLLVDRFGRRKLIIGSYIGVILSLIVLASGFQLAVIYSPSVHPFYSNTTCDSYSSCQGCIEDQYCGFCFHGESWSAPNGTCLPVPKSHNVYGSAAVGPCARPSASRESVWAYGFCPTPYYWLPVVGMAFYLVSFAPGLASVPWIVNTELYPIWARSTGNGIATAVNWTFNVIISMTFLTLVSILGKHGVFWLYTSLSITGVIFVGLLLPETKGKNLEEMDNLFRRTNSNNR